MDHWISMYIDDEMSLDEKIGFVKRIHNDEQYYTVTVSLLRQEKQLQAVLNPPVVEEAVMPTARRRRAVNPGWAAAAVLALALVFLLARGTYYPGQPEVNLTAVGEVKIPHRFVIQHDGDGLVEIAGTFTGWRKLPLQPAGREGYWEITLPLASGEHRYSFLINGTISLPDPTVLAQEDDDFGAVNSILQVGATDARS